MMTRLVTTKNVTSVLDLLREGVIMLGRDGAHGTLELATRESSIPIQQRIETILSEMFLC